MPAHKLAVECARAAIGTGAGVVVLGLGATYVDATAAVPPFPGLSGPGRFGTDAFRGRYCDLLSRVDPFTLRHSHAAIRAAEARVERRESDDASLWADRKLVQSAVHPDTGEIIPQPFRMSGWVPYNAPICVATIMARTAVGQLLGNWLNQSHNALVNYFNRNASSVMEPTRLMQSYVLAVGSAMGMASVLFAVVRRGAPPALAPKLLMFVGFPATVLASSANCFFMQLPNLSVGIPLVDAEGKVVAEGAKSCIAASQAMRETLLSRAVLVVPIFLLPPLVMSLPGLASLPAAQALPVASFVTTVSFGFGLPAAIAIFPETSSIPLEDVEPEFLQHFAQLSRSQIHDVRLFFYKGL